MPELPDILAYIDALEDRIIGETLLDITFHNPFVLRTVQPSVTEIKGRKVLGVRRLGKRIALEFDNGVFLIIHLMIAGRLHWRDSKPNKQTLASFVFSNGKLMFTEAGSQKRASIYLAQGHAGLKEHDPGGIEVMESGFEEFRDALTSENHTLKRSLTDPHIFSGIGNAYSDEILHEARLSPMQLTSRLSDEEIRRLYEAVRSTLALWSERLRAEAKKAFPEKVTAFRPEMAVHGKYGQPCPKCGTPIQRISYAQNEANYCPKCQTGGKLLADRALSRLLKRDWPKTLEEMERHKSVRGKST